MFLQLASFLIGCLVGFIAGVVIITIVHTR